ncbi:hypothetical protein AB0F18_15130 [Streptomyces sp. NPDC029216]|uniref:hypothetical protein n=1 Tax=Streptomyces sp. NPDC029216 TaxID=3154701 RepID=UPI0033FEE2E6
MTTTTPPAQPSAAKAWAAAAGLLLSLALAACGTHVAGRAAPPSPLPASPTCGQAAPDTPTEDETARAPEPPTEDEPPRPPEPPTEDEPPRPPEPPTEEQTARTPEPPTEDEPPRPPEPPTEERTATTPQPPTDGGAHPCAVVDGWYDMTRDFGAYYDRHRTGADGLMPPGSVKDVRVRRTGGTSEARVAFTTGSVGKGLGEDARRVAQVFADWRHEVYGDTGTVRVRTPDGTEIAALPW